MRRWRDIARKLWSDEGQDADLRRHLIESLYASPTSLTIGAIAGAAVSAMVAWEARTPLFIALGTVIVLIALARSVSAIFFHRQFQRGQAHASRGWEFAYEAGAWFYAGMLGIQALLSLLFLDDTRLQLLAVTLATGYAGGISGRNAGRLHIAIGQTCLALLPTSVGLAISGNPAYMVLGGVLFIMIGGMTAISRATHRILVDAMAGRLEKARLATKFERLARFDSLTGVENRMAMQMRLHELYDSRAPIHGRDALAILWLDLDRFKEINDSLGHMVGDQLLRAVAERLTRAVGERGHVARFGGDEFVMLCPQLDRSAAAEIASDILQELGEPLEINGIHIAATGSIGIAIGPQDGRDGDELLRHADMALYHAKHEGRNRYAAFGWGMKERFNRLHDLESGLRAAIDNRELTVIYQPIFAAESGKVSACEALLRWRHPVLGEVSPAEFIPVAESISMIGPMTQWVMTQACRDAAAWPDHIRLAVNISPALLKADDLPRAVMGALLESGLSPRRLELEVTESVFLDANRRTSQLLDELRRIGLRLALDDFGTGYSSLSYLRSHSFDTIKVDQSFMRGAANSVEDRAITQAVADISRKLNIETVAEGIETAQHLAYARDIGFDNVQGYYLCRPLAMADLEPLLREGADFTALEQGEPPSWRIGYLS